MSEIFDIATLWLALRGTKSKLNLNLQMKLEEEGDDPFRFADLTQIEAAVSFIFHNLTDNTVVKSLRLRLPHGMRNFPFSGADQLERVLSTSNNTLRMLDLSSTKLGNHGATILGKVLLSSAQIIEHLEISDNQIDSGGAISLAVALRGSLQLKSLNLSNNPLGTVGVKVISDAIAVNSVLVSLGLSCTHTVTNDSIDSLQMALGANSALEHINISKNQPGLSEIDSLNEGEVEMSRVLQNASIKKIDFTETRTSMLPLSRVLNRNTFLSHLVLDKVYGWVVEATDELCECLARMSQLTRLSVSSCCLVDCHADSFVKLLQITSSLKEVDFSENRFSERGAQAFCKGLSSNSSVEQFSIRKNYIGNSGATSFAELLMRHDTRLRTLDLAFNGVDRGAGDHIADALMKNSCLQTLLLGNNNLDDRSCAIIGEALVPSVFRSDYRRVHIDIGPRVQSSLREIDLSFNQLGNRTAETFAQVIRSNVVVKRIHLRGLCVSSRDTGDAIATAIHDRTAALELNLGPEIFAGQSALLVKGIEQTHFDMQKVVQTDLGATPTHRFCRHLKTVSFNKLLTSDSALIPSTIANCFRCNYSSGVTGERWDLDVVYMMLRQKPELFRRDQGRSQRRTARSALIGNGSYGGTTSGIQMMETD